jgi:hypothetical protein
MTKWEYCVLTGVYGLGQRNPSLFRITASGPELVTDFKNRPRGIDERQAVAQMIFQLGEDGWELILGQNTETFGSSIMWFKRPKS